MNARSANSTEQPDFQHVVNYTVVALIGMLAGFMLGYIFGRDMNGITAKSSTRGATHSQAAAPKNP